MVADAPEDERAGNDLPLVRGRRRARSPVRSRLEPVLHDLDRLDAVVAEDRDRRGAKAQSDRARLPRRAPARRARAGSPCCAGRCSTRPRARPRWRDRARAPRGRRRCPRRRARPSPRAPSRSRPPGRGRAGRGRRSRGCRTARSPRSRDRSCPSEPAPPGSAPASARRRARRSRSRSRPRARRRGRTGGPGSPGGRCTRRRAPSRPTIREDPRPGSRACGRSASRSRRRPRRRARVSSSWVTSLPTSTLPRKRKPGRPAIFSNARDTVFRFGWSGATPSRTRPHGVGQPLDEIHLDRRGRRSPAGARRRRTPRARIRRPRREGDGPASRGCYFGAAALPWRAVRRLVLGSFLVVVCVLAVGALGWIGKAWWDSRLPGTYSVMDYGTLDGGGGPAPASHAAHGRRYLGRRPPRADGHPRHAVHADRTRGDDTALVRPPSRRAHVRRQVARARAQGAGG